MANFLRIYSTSISLSEALRIEGIVVIDQAPPGQIIGVPTGVIAIVGEFQDFGKACLVDANGNVSQALKPYDIVNGPLDFQSKFGGWDETLGKFGAENGNGWLAVRGKAFAPGALVCCAVFLGSSKGIRLCRELPTNTSATNTTPVQPMQATVVSAGREFRSGTNRVRLGTRVIFTGDPAYTSGTDGSVTAAGAAAATQTFNSAGAKFQTGQFLKADGTLQTGVLKGDILVVGVIGGALGLGQNAATYRVQTAPASDTALVVEKLDGSTFDWVTTASLPWRVHPAGSADSAGTVAGSAVLSGVAAAITDVTGYLVPARPLDATVAHDTKLTPTIVPPANAATSWDPLSGLFARTQPGVGNDLVYTAAVQAPNAANSASIDALYQAAIDTLLDGNVPASLIEVVYSARSSDTIRSYLRSHVLKATAAGLPRDTIVEPPINVNNVSTWLGSAAPGVGAARDERVWYTPCGVRQFISEAVGFVVGTSDGKSTSDGHLDVPFGAFFASVISLLAPNRNPGQSSAPIPLCFAPIEGLCRGAPPMDMGTYTLFKQQGIAAVRIDQDGPVIQSGITSSTDSRFTAIARRRMADYIEKSLARAMNPYCKEPMTDQLRTAEVTECQAFLDGLVQQQMLLAGFVDGTTGATPEYLQAGVNRLLIYAKTVPTQDVIELDCQIGNGVVIIT